MFWDLFSCTRIMPVRYNEKNKMLQISLYVYVLYYQKTDFFSVIVVSTICKCLPPGHHDQDELVVDQAIVVNVILLKRWRAQQLASS